MCRKNAYCGRQCVGVIRHGNQPPLLESIPRTTVPYCRAHARTVRPTSFHHARLSNHQQQQSSRIPYRVASLKNEDEDKQRTKTKKTKARGRRYHQALCRCPLHARVKAKHGQVRSQCTQIDVRKKKRWRLKMKPSRGRGGVRWAGTRTTQVASTVVSRAT